MINILQIIISVKAVELILIKESEHRRLHNIGKHFSAETKRKISESLNGRHALNKRRQMTEETRMKMSLAKKEYWKNKRILNQ